MLPGSDPEFPLCFILSEVEGSPRSDAPTSEFPRLSLNPPAVLLIPSPFQFLSLCWETVRVRDLRAAQLPDAPHILIGRQPPPSLCDFLCRSRLFPIQIPDRP